MSDTVQGLEENAPYVAVAHLHDVLSIEQLVLGQSHVAQEFRRYWVNLLVEWVLRFALKT